MGSLLKLVVSVDDFWLVFRPLWHQYLLESGQPTRQRKGALSESEIMTIVILFHHAQYRNFKAFYLGYVDDRKPVPALAKTLFGKLFGDKGYLSAPLRDELREQGVELITSIRRNMKPQLLALN